MTEMLPYADSVVRGLVPGMLDVAGLSHRAEELRGTDILSSQSGMTRACKILQDIQNSELPPMWAIMVEESAYWAEAALWAILSEDHDLFDECESRLRIAIATGFASIFIH